MPMIGVNIDPRGGGIFRPAETELVDFGAVRFIARPHEPFLDTYRNKTIVAILNHETWGEGQGFDFVKEYDNVDFWRTFTDKFVNNVRPMLQRFAHRNQIWWQIWNEPDMGPGARASITMNSDCYRVIVEKISDAINDINPHATILSAGVASGAGVRGLEYARVALPFVDKIAHHVYADNMGAESRAFQRLRKPTVVTETGFIDAKDKTEDDAVNRARKFKQEGARSEAIIWYPWVHQLQDNAFGIRKSDGFFFERLYTELTSGSTIRSAGERQASREEHASMAHPQQAFTNQQFINALAQAGEQHDFPVWWWLKNEGLDFVHDRATRHDPYAGPPIDSLPNLPQEIKDALKQAL